MSPRRAGAFLWPALLVLGCRSSPPPDLLVVTVDTTRADALGAYGGPPGASPHLDALAARGIRFDEVQSTAPLTLPSHAALWTGVHPRRLGLSLNGQSVQWGGHIPLAEHLQTAGYQTAGFVAAAVLDPVFGIDRGFAHYSADTPGPDPLSGAAVPQRDGAEVVDDALGWLTGAAQDTPVFVWVHLYDAHLPVDTPQPYLDRFPDSPYQAEVAELDAHVGRLLAGWREHRSGPLVVSIVGDHGESNGDHGEQTHGWFAYRSTLRVPWLLAGPTLPAGVHTEVVSTLDLAPTLLALLGLPVPAAIDGRNALTPMEGRALLAESWTPRIQFGRSELRVLQDNRYRAILAPRPELYDWRADPGEAHNLADDPRLWSPWEAAFATLEVRSPEAQAPGLDDATQRQLEQLGYVDSPPAVSATTSGSQLPDPKDAPELPQLWSRTMHAARSRPPEEGLKSLEAFDAAHPDVPAADLLRARALGLVGRPDDGLALLAPFLEAGATEPVLDQAAQLELQRGDGTAAREYVKATLKVSPRSIAARVTLAASYLLEERYGDCVAVANAALDRSPKHATLRLTRALCYFDAGNREVGEAELKALLADTPTDRGALFELAMIRADQGDVQTANELLTRLHAIWPEDIDGAAALGMVRARMGDTDAALKLLAPIWEDPRLGPGPRRVYAELKARPVP